jgi:hypothetical protein
VLREVADIPHQRRGVGLVAQQRTELQATHDVMGEGAVGPSALTTAEPSYRVVNALVILRERPAVVRVTQDLKTHAPVRLPMGLLEL